MDKLEKYYEKLEIANDELDVFRDGWDFQRTYEEYEVESELFYEKIAVINRAIRLLKPFKLKDKDGHGSLMTLEDFVDSCKSGGFIDYDGFGNYSTKDKISDITIYPSDVEANELRSNFTHVTWYNR